MFQFHIHIGYKTLYSFIPKTTLPSNYDGDGDSIEQLEGKYLIRY